MSTDELLRPRYKVIADYPYSIFKVGEVLSSFDQFSYISESDCRKYPHLFKPLEWWEDRKESDMPEYVKAEDGVYKVQEWHVNLAPKVSVFIDTKIHKGYVEDCTECPLYSDFLPATKEEYESQK